MANKLRILMLEDNPTDAELNEYALHKGGIFFASKRVVTSEEFEVALREFAPEIILSDYDLPSFDGIAAMTMAKATCPEIPFIFVTGVMGEEMAIDTLKKGATDYVLKNRLSRLTPAVRRALDEVKTRNERQRAEEALRESEHRYRAVFESTGTAMCVIEDGASISFINKQFERLFGYAAADVEGRKNILDFLVGLEMELEDFKHYHMEILDGGTVSFVPFACKVRARDRRVLSVLVTMGMLPGTRNCVVSINDVTREKKYEQELSERAERLEHFLTIASHELRHPITVIKGYAMMLNRRPAELSPDALIDIYSSIDDSANRLARIIQELMDVSRFEEIDMLKDKRACDLGVLVRHAVDEMVARGAENEFVVDMAPDAGTANVDPDKFGQLLLILLDNAVNYSPHGSPVEVQVTKNDSLIIFCVLDRGPGVPAEDRKRIFERFYQVADIMHHSTPGLGLGLYIAKKIVDAHGGNIRYEPREGGGSIFTLTLSSGRTTNGN